MKFMLVNGIMLVVKVCGFGVACEVIDAKFNRRGLNLVNVDKYARSVKKFRKHLIINLRVVQVVCEYCRQQEAIRSSLSHRHLE